MIRVMAQDLRKEKTAKLSMTTMGQWNTLASQTDINFNQEVARSG